MKVDQNERRIVHDGAGLTVYFGNVDSFVLV